MKNFSGIIYAIISSATFGLIPLFSIPLQRDGVSTPTILFYRMGIAALVIGLLGLVTKQNFKIGFKDMLVFIAVGALYAVTALGLLVSYNYIPSGVATTIHFLYPLIVALIMMVFFKERSTMWLLIAALISLVGVALLGWDDGGGEKYIRGVLIVLVTVVTYATYIVCVNRTRIKAFDSLVLTFYILVVGAVIFFIYAMFATDGLHILPSKKSVLDVFLLALLPTVLSNITLVMAVKRIGSTTTSVLGSMEPLTAMIVGVFHFGEVFDLRSGVGMCMIIVAVIVVIMQDKLQKSKL